MQIKHETEKFAAHHEEQKVHGKNSVNDLLHQVLLRFAFKLHLNGAEFDRNSQK